MLSGIHVNKLSKAESPEKVERVYLPKTVWQQFFVSYSVGPSKGILDNVLNSSWNK